MDVPVQSILLLHKLYRKQNRRLIWAEAAVWRNISSKVALDLNHVKIRGLGMGGKRAGGGGENIKIYSKRKQKLVVCLAKQMLLFVSVVCPGVVHLFTRSVQFPFWLCPIGV